MSTAGLVLGITGLAFCIAGFLFFFPILLAPLFVAVGLPLSGAAFYRARTDRTSLIIPLVGLAAGAVTALLSIPLGWIYVAFALPLGNWAP